MLVEQYYNDCYNDLPKFSLENIEEFMDLNRKIQTAVYKS